MIRLELAACVAILGVLAVSSVGCGGSAPSAAKKATAASSVPQVAAAKPVRKTLSLTTTQPGRIEAFETTPLHAKVAGYVESLLVDIGDKVSKDQVLVRLSIPELKDELLQREALVASAEAQVKQAESAQAAAEAAAETATAKIIETEAGIARVEAERDRWNSEYDRIKELAAKGSVTQKLEEETQSQLKGAEAAIREIEAKLQSVKSAAHEAQANVKKSEADRGAAEADLGVAKAELGRARTMLSYTEIRAPFDGTVTVRNVDTGHFVQPASEKNAQPLMVVARTDIVRVFVDVPEMEAPYLNVDDPAKLRLQAVPGKELAANVVRTSWSLTESNHSLRAEIDVPNPDGELRPGMYAAATIKLEEVADALVIPMTALLRDSEGAACMVVENGKAVRKPLELGLRSGAEIQVLSGLSESDLVVQKQPETLKAGQEVALAPAS
jgi:HlyD family secretion protein